MVFDCKIATSTTTKRKITTAVFLVSRGGRKEPFQQSVSTLLGAGEKETLKHNVVGKGSKEENTVKV